MGALEEIFETGRYHKHGCRVCGADAQAQIQVLIRELVDNGDGKGRTGGGRSRSRSANLCPDHAAERYERVLDALGV